jgi:DNA-binding CsgD family transcriptional regulator/tetratricopeptide (TPR) repeat protein
VEAAREAERVHAFSAAWRYWEIAAGLTVDPPPPDTPAQCLWRAAEAAHLAGDQETALNLTDRLALGRTGLPPEETGPDAQQVRLLRARCLTDLGRLNEALSEYERALAVPGLSNASRADLNALLAETLMRSGQYDAAWERSGLALSLAAAEADGGTSAQVIAGSALGFSQAYLGDVDAGCATLRQAVRVADDSGDSEIIGVAHLYLAELLVGPLNQIEEGIQTARSGVAAVAAASGSPARRVELLAAAANGLFRLGRWDEAAQLCSQALEDALTGTAAADLLLARARIVMATGDLDRAEQDLRSVQTLLAGSDGGRQLLPLATLRAGLAIWRREPLATRIAVRDGLSSVGRDTRDAWLLAPLIWHGLHGEADAAARNEEVDQELIRTLTGTAADLSEQASRAASSIRRWVEGYALLNAAELSRIAAEPDPEAWRLAAKSWDEHRQPYPATYARFRESEALFFQRSRNSAAADLLRATYQKAAALRAAPLLAEIEALAARAHVTLGNEAAEEAMTSAGPSDPGPAESLTRRERQVWQELGAGHTNREIAGHLFISERTVEAHVSRILAKLNARTRVEAATAYVNWAAAHRDDP